MRRGFQGEAATGSAASGRIEFTAQMARHTVALWRPARAWSRTTGPYGYLLAFILVGIGAIRLHGPLARGSLVISASPSDAMVIPTEESRDMILSRIAPIATAIAAATCHAAELRVPEDHPTIQSAIAAAANGDTISIAPGSYGPIDLQSKALILSGRGLPAETTIDGGGTSRVVEASGVAKGSVELRSLTIANGHADGADGAVGAGIRAVGTSLALTNVTVRGCSILRSGSGPADALGAGVFVSDRTLVVDGCEFVGNSIQFSSDGTLNPLAGGAAIGGVNAQFSCNGTAFALNTVSASSIGGSWQNIFAWGGAVYLRNSPGQISGCSFVDNTCSTTNAASGAAAAIAGGGAVFAEGRALDILSSTFARNRATTASVTTYSIFYNNAIGGAVWFRISEGELSVDGSLFDSNSCNASLVRPGMSGGGAVCVQNASARFTAATFLTNETAAGPQGGMTFGGAVGVGDGSVVLLDSQLCANSIPQSGIQANASNATIAIPSTTCVSAHDDCSLCAPPCAGDLAADGVVNGIDAAIVLSLWGSDGSGYPGSDIDGDGVVGAADLAALLNAWGPCPQ